MYEINKSKTEKKKIKSFNMKDFHIKNANYLQQSLT